MNTPASNQNDLPKVSFVVSFEGVHGILVDIHVYVFDTCGALIGRQVVRRGRAVIPMDSRCHGQARVVLAPSVDDLIHGPVTLSSIRGFHAFETDCKFDSDMKVHFLPEVPESVWRWWLVHSLWNTLSASIERQSSARV